MEGMVSTCKLVIMKTYFTEDEKPEYEGYNIMSCHWAKEYDALKQMGHENHIPELYSTYENVMYMEYCGDKLTRENMPEDWEKQCEEIEKIQVKYSLFHFDIFQKNLTVKDGIIYLIDWGFWTPKKNKYDIFETVRAINRLFERKP